MAGISTINRNQSIDLIKIIAMFGVISLHCNLGRLDNPVAFVLSRIAGISIPLFIMVSGYLLAYKNGEWGYVMKKILGIVKYVFICCLAYWIIHICHHQSLDASFFTVFAKSFIQKGPFWMFWYFGAMCIIYLLLPLLKWGDCHYEYFYIKLFIALVCIDFFIFMMTFLSRWEYSVVQTFRIWNWLTYFSLGVIVRKYQLSIQVSPLLLIASMVLFVGFVYWSKDYIGEVEHFFVTPLCMLYSFLAFIYITSKQISNNHVIANLSPLFLPVYTTHYFIIRAYHYFCVNVYIGMLTPFIDFFLVSVITIVICYGIMKIPYSRNIFKI